MTVVYYTSTYFLDISIELIKILKSHVQLHVLIEITATSKKANIINIEKLPEHQSLVKPEDLLKPEDYAYLKPYLEGVASVHFVIHPHKTGLSLTTIKTNLMVWRYIKAFKPQVIHFESFSLRAVGLIPFLPKFEKVLLAIHDPVFHSGENNWKTSLPRRLFFRLPIKKYLIFYSSFSKTLFENHYKNNKQQKLVIAMRPYSYYAAFGKNATVSRRHILFFGRLSPYKGIDILLKAIPEVLKQAPNELFVIAGRSPGSYKLNEEILDQHRENILILNKYIPNEELASLIRNSKFVVCPYRDATQSGVLMTSYAFNTPVVATAVGAFPEYIEDEITGMLVQDVDHKQLADRIVAALKTYNEMRQNLENRDNGALWDVNRPMILQAYSS